MRSLMICTAHQIYITGVNNSKLMRWAGHVARMGERRGVYRAWLGNLREIDHLEDPSVDVKIILNVSSRKIGGHGPD
jgi:hypothetical protein